MNPASLLPALAGAALADRVARVDDGATTVYPEELALLASAGPARRAEVLTGRALAHDALEELGAPAASLGRRDDRSPAWPDGFGGSISHAGGWCVVVVARLAAGWGVGIDLERDEPLTPAVAARVLRPDERARLDRNGSSTRDAVLVFSAKESVFKAANPVTGAWFEHHDVDIDLGSLGDDAGGFATSFPGRGRRAVESLVIDGRWQRVDGFVLTGCVVRPRP
jgi:4'-phosphopantetheinyl transferase EntD